MLFLIFQLDGERYALDASHIVEVLPLVRVKKIPQAPAALAGVFDYRGAPVPVLDLSQLALGRPAQPRLSTRTVLVRQADAPERLLGLIVENVAETQRRDPREFVDSGVHNTAAPFLGAVAVDGRGMVQRIELARLLPPAVRQALARSTELA
jgi:chemotaxis-related protein WspB